MLDLLNLPASIKGDVQVFTANVGGTTFGWQTWNKPRGCSMVYITAIGAGGAGGNGAVGAVSAAAGGAGGGSGAMTHAHFPAFMLPDLLNVFVGTGGRPGGATPAATLIQVETLVGAAQSRVIFAAAGLNGGNATGGTPGANASGGAVTTVANMGYGAFAKFFAVAGQTSSSAMQYSTTGLCLTAGGQGGALPASDTLEGRPGGALAAAGEFPAMVAALGGQTTSTRGQNGQGGGPIQRPKVFGFFGGGGGGSTHGGATGAAIVAGNGGNGGFGCGGGGGGGAVTTGIAGVGGGGGDGLVIIISV